MIGALVLMSLSASSHANEFDGFNAGLGLSYVKPEVVYTDDFSGYGKWNDASVIAMIDIGYNKSINADWLLGIGMTYDLTETDAGSDYPYGPVETTLKDHYSVYIQPTYTINATSAVIAKVSYHSMRVEANGKPPEWIDDRFKVNGVGYGIGYKQLLNDNFYIQAEIQVVDYKDKILEGGEWAYQQKTKSAIISAGYNF